MKHHSPAAPHSPGHPTFSALGRAVWDETPAPIAANPPLAQLSVLSVEPYGMKHRIRRIPERGDDPFSALGRAVWDETAVGAPVALLIAAVFQCSRSSRMG